ncbi:hypothetical protein ACWDYJ_29300 [Streptomyces sp. NPDC003042]
MAAASSYAASCTRHWLDATLDHARVDPDIGGPLVLRHVPPEAYTVTPRLNVLTPHQVDALTGRKKPRASVRGA